MLVLLWISLVTAEVMCCYYRQHYHNAYCNDKNDLGCVLGPALIAGPPKIICRETLDCLPGMANQGYWLEGFGKNCEECN